jgi:hypothetical protein
LRAAQDTASRGNHLQRARTRGLVRHRPDSLAVPRIPVSLDFFHLPAHGFPVEVLAAFTFFDRILVIAIVETNEQPWIDGLRISV